MLIEQQIALQTELQSKGHHHLHHGLLFYYSIQRPPQKIVVVCLLHEHLPSWLHKQALLNLADEIGLDELLYTLAFGIFANQLLLIKWPNSRLCILVL